MGQEVLAERTSETGIALVGSEVADWLMVGTPERADISGSDVYGRLFL